MYYSMNTTTWRETQSIFMMTREKPTASLDPICSFTFKSPGILLVKRKSESKGKSEKKKTNEASILLLFQNPGDCVVMSGHFQQFYQHAVPARNKWADIRENRQYEGVPTSQ